MINAEQKQEIQEALNYCYDEILDDLMFGVEHGIYDSDYAEKYVCDRAKDRLTDNLGAFELLDINLNDSALVEQEKEVINYIENEL